MDKNEYGCVKTQITRPATDLGESIEEMVRRCTASNEPIEASAPMIYTEEKDGVQPQYDIRTDRFDLALDAIDKYQASQAAKSKEITETPKDNATPSGQGEQNKE